MKISPEVFAGLPYKAQAIITEESKLGDKDRLKIKSYAVLMDICHKYNLSIDAIASKSRKKGTVLPRQIAMFMLRHQTKMTFKEIGDLFGSRDHSTAIYACNTVQDLIDVYPDFAQEINELTNKYN